MIDDPAQVTAFMQQMEAHLPILAQATSALVRTLRESAVKLSPRRRVQIAKVIYLGDEGGIGCGLTVPGHAATAVGVSLTHLRLPSPHPLAQPYAHTKSHARENSPEGSDARPSPSACEIGDGQHGHAAGPWARTKGRVSHGVVPWKRQREEHQREQEPRRPRKVWAIAALGHRRVVAPSRGRGGEGQHPTRGST